MLHPLCSLNSNMKQSFCPVVPPQTHTPLHSIGISHFIKLLAANGVDDTDTLACFTTAELKEMGIPVCMFVNEECSLGFV